jgi:hypothetical protein
MTPLARVLGALPHQAQKTASGYEARCPAHEDQHASLSITEGQDGRVLLCCHAGCKAPAIVGAMGLTIQDLFPPRERREPERAYDYRDEDNALLYQVVRFPGKTFRQRRPDGNGGWIWKLEGTRRVLYRLPDIKGHAAVFLVEGEKDVETLRTLGLPATCNPHGAGKWRDDYAAQLKAVGVQRICVLPDNDPPGEAHARQLARSCYDAGLTVRVLPLPGLPEKGDVTDWLSTHNKAELLEAARVCPPFNPSRSATAGFKLELTSLADLLAEPDEAVEWLVEDRIPAGAVVLLAGKPKAGKSTLARALAYALTSGDRWLGWRTHFGPAWYLAFEDKRSEMRRHFRQMGATGREPLRLFINQSAPELLPALYELAEKERPAVIFVDTLQRLINAKDMNDYAEITTKCAPLLKLARDTGATLVLVHHANKFGEGLDSILGSTALAGSVDNVFILGRGERYRTLSSIQRIGTDLEPIVVTLDETTGRVDAAGRKQDAEEADAADKILDALNEAEGPVTENWIKNHVDGRLQDTVRGLRLLVRQGRVIRSGRGGKGDPFQYVASHKEEDRTSTRVTNFVGSQVPYIYREPRNRKESEAGSLVPDTSANSGNSDPKTAKHRHKQGTDSGSGGSLLLGDFKVEPVSDSGSRDFGDSRDVGNHKESESPGRGNLGNQHSGGGNRDDARSF